MSDLVQILSDPTVQHYLGRAGDSFTARFGAGVAGIMLDRMKRFAKNELANESPQTVVKSLERMEMLFVDFDNRVKVLEGDLSNLRVLLDDPQGSAVAAAAIRAATQTGDRSTIGILASIIAIRLTSGSDTRLAIRLREAAEVSQNLLPRDFDTLAIMALANGMIYPGEGGVAPTADQRSQIFGEWFAAAIAKLEVHEPLARTWTDVTELESHGLIIAKSNSVEYDGKMGPPNAPSAGRYLGPNQGAGAAFPASMQRLAGLEFGLDQSGTMSRALELPALGAWKLTNLALLLAMLALQARGVDICTNFGQGE
ncbi:MAG: hypothetical protein NVSMB5_23260 [Candidatus Velthaea sp.]